jgi:RNA polymerase sigma-70 factor (ECF subfamily)
MDDELLMARFAAGRADAFDELYDRYEGPLYGFCARLLGDEDKAADAFQETFVKVIEQRASYRAGRFRSWVFTIARNECLDRMRRAGRQARLLELHAAEAPRRVDVVSAIDARDELTELLASLSAEQREITLLHRYHGFSYAEIARMIGSSEAATKQKAYRALLSLRQARQDK